MVHSFLSQIVFAFLAATCVLAFVKGGAAERWGAVLIGAGWLIELVLSLVMNRFFSPQVEELTMLGVDGFLALGLLIVALRFTKIWLGIAMLMQSGELALHGAAMADWGFQFRKYIFLNNLLSLGLLVLLAGAVITAWIQGASKNRQLAAGKDPWIDGSGQDAAKA